jgi:hypothetical protein
VLWSRAETLWMMFDLGRWDEILETSKRVLEEDDPQSQITTMAASFRALVLARRGRVGEAESLVELFLPRARSAGDPQVLSPALLIAAEIALGRGDRGGALALLTEIEERTRDQPFWTLLYLADIARGAVACGDPTPAESLLATARPGPARHDLAALGARAVLRESAGDLEDAARLHAEAASGWRGYGNVVEEAMANLGAGRTLVQMGRLEEPLAPLRAARGTFSAMGAAPLLVEADEWLERAIAVSS